MSFTYGDFEFEETNNGLCLYNYHGKSSKVEIPSQVKDKPVITIGGNAFRGKQLESVTIPDGVEKNRM